MGALVTASVDIHRPIDAVFAYVVDLDNAPRWQGELVEIKDVSATPMGVGTTMMAVLRYLGRHVENRMQVTHFEPPRRFSLGFVSGYLPVDLDFILEPVEGGTRVTYLGDWRLPGGFPFRLLKPAKPLFDRMDKKEWQSNLTTLKELLEDQRGDSSSLRSSE